MARREEESARIDAFTARVPLLANGEGVVSLAAPAVVEAAGDTEVDAVRAVEGGEWPDDSAESAFLAEARDRGEAPVQAKAPDEAIEPTDARALPPLEDLVKRISPEVRDLLEDLFRARFVRVQRVPKKALKA